MLVLMFCAQTKTYAMPAESEVTAKTKCHVGGIFLLRSAIDIHVLATFDSRDATRPIRLKFTDEDGNSSSDWKPMSISVGEVKYIYTNKGTEPRLRISRPNNGLQLTIEYNPTYSGDKNCDWVRMGSIEFRKTQKQKSRYDETWAVFSTHVDQEIESIDIWPSLSGIRGELRVEEN